MYFNSKLFLSCLPFPASLRHIHGNARYKYSNRKQEPIDLRSAMHASVDRQWATIASQMRWSRNITVRSTQTNLLVHGMNLILHRAVVTVRHIQKWGKTMRTKEGKRRRYGENIRHLSPNTRTSTHVVKLVKSCKSTITQFSDTFPCIWTTTVSRYFKLTMLLVSQFILRSFLDWIACTLNGKVWIVHLDGQGRKFSCLVLIYYPKGCLAVPKKHDRIKTWFINTKQVY